MSSAVDSRFFAPWELNFDLALMGIQSTPQFVDKYDHVIGKLLTESHSVTCGPGLAKY